MKSVLDVGAWRRDVVLEFEQLSQLIRATLRPLFYFSDSLSNACKPRGKTRPADGHNIGSAVAVRPVRESWILVVISALHAARSREHKACCSLCRRLNHPQCIPNGWTHKTRPCCPIVYKGAAACGMAGRLFLTVA